MIAPLKQVDEGGRVVGKGRGRGSGTNMSRTIRFFSMYYISSRSLENLPSEIYSHLIEKRPKDKIFAIEFIFI